MTPDTKQYLKEKVIPEFNKLLAKELNLNEVPNIKVNEFKIECLARKRAVKMAKEFINLITENEFEKDIKEDFGTVDFIVDRPIVEGE
jgi:hypothetical protein